MRSVLDTRYRFKATVLNVVPDNADVDPDAAVQGGHWVTSQDDTGAITRIWVEDVSVVPPTRPGTNWTDAGVVDRFDIECTIRGFQQGAGQSSTNTESFAKGDYTVLELVQMNFPAKYVLNRRQLITNIRNRSNQILWLEEETGKPTVFEVQGVTPQFDPFDRYIDNLAVLTRSDKQ
jgi:hypothetical protein